MLRPHATSEGADRRRVPSGMPPRTEEGSVADSKSLTGVRVMVIDDSNTIRRSAEIFLMQAGCQVILAENGFDALATIADHQPDLILMDVVMPGLNGFQATRAITREEKTKHIPVIICTTKDQETDKIWGLRQGAKDYVTKPLNEADLVEKIKALG